MLIVHIFGASSDHDLHVRNPIRSAFNALGVEITGISPDDFRVVFTAFQFGEETDFPVMNFNV